MVDEFIVIAVHAILSFNSTVEITIHLVVLTAQNNPVYKLNAFLDIHNRCTACVVLGMTYETSNRKYNNAA